MKIIYIFCVSLLLTSCVANQKITKKEAIGLAEKYVVEQGFTDKKPDLNTTQIDLDIVEAYLEIDRIVELRYNQLDDKAIYSKKIKEGWIIGFDYKERRQRKGLKQMKEVKAVLISKNGKDISMIHENLLIK